MTEVMFNGPLRRDSLDLAMAKIERAVSQGEKDFKLTINSKGGHTLPTLLFIERIKSLEGQGVRFSIMILEAKSAASVLALSVGTKRQIAPNSAISFHLGNIDPLIQTLGPSTAKVEALVQKNLHAYSDKLAQVLETFGVSKQPKMMETLNRTGWLKLSDKACLELGIVSEII